MSITTKRGDEGQTDLLFGRRVSKTHPRVQANGDIDELNATLGLARASATQPLVRDRVAALQSALVQLMGEIATSKEDLARYAEFGRITDDEMVNVVHGWIRELEHDYGVSYKSWATPGQAGSLAGGFLDLARTVCRRAERSVAGLLESGELENRSLLRYLNRISDLCWLLARFEEGAGQPRVA